MRFPESRVLPYLVKPLTRRAVRLPHWPQPINQLVGAMAYPFVQVLSRSRPLRAECEPVRRFDAAFTALWEKLADRFDLAVRRDAAYLNWRYIEPPHVRYSAVALKRQGEVHGYAVYRHKHEPLGRVTMLVDLPDAPRRRVGASRRCCAGSIAPREPKTRTRCDATRCTARSGGCCGATATSASSRASRWR